MPAAQTSEIMRFLRGILRPPQAEEATDGQLLGRFVEHRDETAFAALVRSLGPLVRGVCRRLLGNRQDTEDAFQATFLVSPARRRRSRRARGSPAGFTAWRGGRPSRPDAPRGGGARCR